MRPHLPAPDGTGRLSSSHDRTFVRRESTKKASSTTWAHSGMKSRVQRGSRQLNGMLEACCTIDLDQRRGVVDYDVLNQPR